MASESAYCVKRMVFFFFSSGISKNFGRYTCVNVIAAKDKTAKNIKRVPERSLGLRTMVLFACGRIEYPIKKYTTGQPVKQNQRIFTIEGCS